MKTATVTKLADAKDDVALAVQAMADLTEQLKSFFLERDSVIDGIAAALVAGEHVLLLGPPGTAKSELVHAFCSALGGNFFSTLCNRFQTPDEVFGPLSLKALQEDRLLRSTANRLPEADVAFLDECYKGSSALLNSLLRAINERSFEQDGSMVKMPLRLVVGASNELPDEQDGLGAFHDRFLLRYQVERLKEEGSVCHLLTGKAKAEDLTFGKVTIAQLMLLQSEARDVQMMHDALSAIIKIRSELHEKGIRVSDRRWSKAIGLLRAEAVLRGRDNINSAGLAILEHCLWDRPEQIPVVREVVSAHVASWIKAGRDAHAALDEQLVRIREAAKTGGTRHLAVGQIAKCVDVLVDIDASIDAILKSSPDANELAEQLRTRLRSVKVEAQRAMKAHGYG